MAKKAPAATEQLTQYLANLRHSCAHLLAKSVLELYPGVHNAIGPAIENGFYQDFDMGDHQISEADLPKIEAKMREILPTWQKFTFKEVSLAQAEKLFAKNPYKVALAREFASGGKKLMTNNPGNFLDLCKMGHVENPAQELPHFKLLSIAGAYWKADAKNRMLVRIYGTCFPTKPELDAYLWQLEEARKRDHRKIGKDLDLFTFSPLVGAGLPLFLPKGAMVKYLLEEYMREAKQALGYKFVHIPHIAKPELYRRSGHFGKYDAMMPIMETDQGDAFVMKAMNCPHHFEIYNSRAHSYRDLPIRLAENTTVYRNEKSGEISGLLRVRSLTQDDTHHFVRHDQIQSEIEMITGLMQSVYRTFGFTEYKVQISLRDPAHPEKYFGDDKLWRHAESVLVDAIKKWGQPYTMETGEAAFYGPKIDIMVKDAIGRSWQLTTIQLDFSQPENFDMTYVGEDGKNHRPAVLHVAILGSTERFLGVLIEHFIGAFPAWLAPVQVHIIAVSDASHPYAEKVAAVLRADGRRVELDLENASVGKKIRAAEMSKVPYMLVVGEKEAAAGSVSVRSYHAGDLGSMKLANFQKQLTQEVAERRLPVTK